MKRKYKEDEEREGEKNNMATEQRRKLCHLHNILRVVKLRRIK
jgi:hypothetical protein